MMNIPEQLSAARKSQLDAQLSFFNSFTSKAVANAEKIVALNLNLTRDTMAKSTAVLCEALSARAPADLLALSSRAPDTFSTLVAYSRDLMAIAAGGVASVGTETAAAPASAFTPTAVPFKAVQPAQDAIEQIVEQAADTATAPVTEPEIASASLFEAEAAPAVTAKPMAKAVSAVGASNGALKSAAAPMPSADGEVKVSGIKPVDASPPAAPATGTPEVVQHDPAAAKEKRKK